MPSNEIMPLFRAGKLHSGKSGKIVTNPHQAKAILLSYLKSEGKLDSQVAPTVKRRKGKRK